ncbi:kinase-like domain-containing protein [Aspergillus keveii]|uniref:Kinase-like domain-containing protein n=1 Tax=Aspergillus keveii TaxID=714993 RepID=A0ABR4FKS7_9EURO
MFLSPSTAHETSQSSKCTPFIMNVIQCSEYFGRGDEPVAFQYSRIIFQRDGLLYEGRSTSRYRSKTDVKEEDLYKITAIAVENLHPDYERNFTKACNYLETDEWYVKRLNLSHYDLQNPDRLKGQTIEEVKTCEYLKERPHPNIAVYHGCEVKDGKITGLCFQRYGETLMERVNPMKYNKQRFPVEVGGGISPHIEHIERWLDNIKGGILHLHSLGIIHNDINPSNIMFDGDTPVIIDFGSCRPRGHDLGMVGRTYEWHDSSIMEAKPSNDLDALEEMRHWLSGSVENFKF